MATIIKNYKNANMAPLLQQKTIKFYSTFNFNLLLTVLNGSY